MSKLEENPEWVSAGPKADWIIPIFFRGAEAFPGPAEKGTVWQDGVTGHQMEFNGEKWVRKPYDL